MRVGRSRGHFVVKANDGEAEERDAMFGAENAFVVDVDVEEFMERFNVANAPRIRSSSR